MLKSDAGKHVCVATCALQRSPVPLRDFDKRNSCAMQLIVRAVSDLDGSCGVSLTASGFTDGNNLDAIPEDVFDCAINASAVPASFAQDAVANATIVTAASACELASSVNLTSAATVRCYPPLQTTRRPLYQPSHRLHLVCVDCVGFPM